MSDLTEHLAVINAEVKAAASRRSPLYQMLRLHSMSHVLIELHQVAIDNSDECVDEGWMQAANQYEELAAQIDQVGAVASAAERMEGEQV